MNGRPLPDAQPVTGTIEPEQVVTGDLLFCARPSPLQDLCTRAGEPWRHVGLAVVVDGAPAIVEVAGATFGLRTLTTALANVTDAAVARVAAPARTYAEQAAAWCAAHVGREQVYAWDDIILAGFIAATRRFCLPQERQRLERAVTTAVDSLRSHQQARTENGPDLQQSYSCSAFVLAAFIEVGYPLAFDLAGPRAVDLRPSLWEIVRGGDRPLRSASGTRMAPEQGVDVVRALVQGLTAGVARNHDPATTPSGTDDWYRWATPGDIWRSETLFERLRLER